VGCSSPAPSRSRLPTSGFASNQGIRIHCLDWGGEGEPVVFVPGLGVTAAAFSDLAPKLVRSYRVVAVDRRGAGKSDRPPPVLVSGLADQRLVGLAPGRVMPHNMKEMKTYERLQLAGAATTFRLCAKEQPMKQTTRRCAKYRRARS
jgi:pimeloyl-ACP methyl ester carboxylesterase